LAKLGIGSTGKLWQWISEGRKRLTRLRMGGPRAWKEMQKKQQEFQNNWDQEEQTNDNSDDEDGEGKDMEKRDLYAEYDVEPETENEKSQRAKGVGDTGELSGQEDV
jgi:Swi5-dependent recombination DNA repair protein 1